MRIRRSVTRFFGILVIPAISLAAISYFGYYTVWGSRGMMALFDTEARLSLKQEELVSLSDQRTRLQRRIHLLEGGDVDIITEVLRSQMLGNLPGQVAVPRDHK